MAAEDVVIVYDASGSMWGQIDGTAKVQIARDVLSDLVEDWDAGTQLGLVAYGHRNKGDCRDIETLIAPGPLDKKTFIERVNGIRPVGKTPLTAAVQHAAELMVFRDTPATVVLISDGVETCNADPCALSAQLAQQGVQFKAHVVGFDLDSEGQGELACIAENTGGVFVPASNAVELKEALDLIQATMIPAETVSEPEPELLEVALTAPEQVTNGATFEFSWSGTINGQDFLTIVPMGADERTIESHLRAKDNSEGRLTAPGTPGLYELRYVLEEGRRVLASQTIEVVEAEVTVSGPEQVTNGATFEFSWSGTINGQDFLTIVPMGADERTIESHLRAKDNSEGRLTAPGTPGLYELRYVLEEGRRVLASQTIEVVEAEVTVSGPEQVTNGATFEFSWSGTINGQDFLTIVPMGADERTVESHLRAKDNSEGRLTAPGTPGLYELRYVLEEGRRVLASASVEVVEAEIGISGPGTVRAGADVDVTWSSTVNAHDFITIVPAGADAGTVADHIRTRSTIQGRLKAPEQTGLYEIRYVLDEGRVTLASAMLEVVVSNAPIDHGAGLSAPTEATPGSTITVTWTGGGEGADQRITLAGRDQTDFGWISAQKIAAEKSIEITLPNEPGLYEVRFLDLTNQAVLGRSVVEVK